MEKPIFRKKNRLFTLHRWLWILSGAVAVFMVVLVILPIAVEWTMEHWLRNHGAPQAQIEDVDLNLFTGRFVLRKLQAGSAEKHLFRIASLSADLDWWPLIHKRVFMKQIRLEGAKIDAGKSENGTWYLGEVQIPMPVDHQGERSAANTGNIRKKPWGFGVSTIQIEASHIRYHDAQLDGEVGFNKINLAHVISWEPEASTSVNVELNINGGDCSFTGNAKPFARQPQVTGMLNVRDLDFQPFQKLLKGTSLKKLQGKLSLDLKVEAVRQSSEKNHITADGELLLKRFSAEMDNLDVQQQQLTWKGTVNLQIPAPAQQQLLAVDGKLYLDNLNLDLRDQNLRISQKSLTWSGDASVVAPGTKQETGIGLTMTADSDLNGLQVVDTSNNLILSKADSISLKSIRTATLNDVSLQQLLVKDMLVLQSAQQQSLEQKQTQTAAAEARLVSVKKLSVENIKVSDLKTVNIENLQLGGAGVDLTREKDGQWRWLKELAGGSPPPNQNVVTTEQQPLQTPTDVNTAEIKNSEGGADGATQSMRFAIAQIEIGENSWLKYTDDTVEPAYNTLIQPLQISIKALTNADDQQPSPIALQAKMGEYTSITANGEIFPFAEKPTADLTVKVSSLDIPQLSAFIPAYNIQRGRLYATVLLKLDQGKLDVHNHLLLSKLKMIVKTKGEAGLAAEGLSMPLDVALDLLRDRKDQIELQIPISGDLEKPEFDLQGVINKATAKALQKAALAYVKHALQPLGTVLLVANIAGKMSRPRFKPLLFEPGESRLNRRATGYLNKIAGLLRDRPRINLTFCGVATPGDKKVLLNRAVKALQQKQPELKGQQKPPIAKPEIVNPASPNAKSTAGAQAVTPVIRMEDLLALARHRGDAMKKYLTEQKKIQPERLYSCKPTVSQDAKSQPRVEITL